MPVYLRFFDAGTIQFVRGSLAGVAHYEGITALKSSMTALSDSLLRPSSVSRLMSLAKVMSLEHAEDAGICSMAGMKQKREEQGGGGIPSLLAPFFVLEGAVIDLYASNN